MKISRSLAKALMRAWPSYPSQDSIQYQEIFNHDLYLKGHVEQRRAIQLRSSRWRYEYEKQKNFFESYFPRFNTDAFRGKSILDLGCFTGGRLVFWAEKYGFGASRGIDVKEVYAEAGNLFASQIGVSAQFDTGYGEKMPYGPDSFDYIVSVDVFEHVMNVEQTLNECFRVLRPGGKLLAIFPPFFQPFEAHLTLVTKVPALHWFFNGRTITEAYHDIEVERGEEAQWYAMKSAELEDWEKLRCLNGITVAKWRRIFKKNPLWKLSYWGNNPIFSDGRISSKTIFRVLRLFFLIPARLPYLEELFLGRICCILEKAQSHEQT